MEAMKISRALRARARRYPPPVPDLGATLAANLKLYAKRPDPTLGIYTINNQIETASSALSVLQSLVAEKLHEDDRRDIDGLVNRARGALDRTSTVLSELRRKLEDVADSL